MLVSTFNPPLAGCLTLSLIPKPIPLLLQRAWRPRKIPPRNGWSVSNKLTLTASSSGPCSLAIFDRAFYGFKTGERGENNNKKRKDWSSLVWKKRFVLRFPNLEAFELSQWSKAEVENNAGHLKTLANRNPSKPKDVSHQHVKG